MATRLSKLKIEEMSGVESPANELPGFLVMKAKEAGITDEELLKQVDRMESDLAILYSSLQAAQAYLQDAPDDVQTAAQTLSSYIEQMFSDGTGDGTGTGQPPADQSGAQPPAPVQASADKDAPGLLVQIGVEKDKGDGEEPEPEPEPAAKSEKDEPEAEEEPATKSEKDEPEEEPAEKSAPDEDTLAKALTTALEPVLTRLSEVSEGVDTTKTAVGAIADRVGALEAGRQGLDPEVVTPTTKATDGGAAALHAGVMAAVRGQRVTLG